jgi:hypothetical protein
MSPLPPPSPYEPPADDQIVVWTDDAGTPVVLALFDLTEDPNADAHRDTYRGFVERVGRDAADAAIRLYRMNLTGD